MIRGRFPQLPSDDDNHDNHDDQSGPWYEPSLTNTRRSPEIKSVWPTQRAGIHFEDAQIYFGRFWEPKPSGGRTSRWWDLSYFARNALTEFNNNILKFETTPRSLTSFKIRSQICSDGERSDQCCVECTSSSIQPQ